MVRALVCALYFVWIIAFIQQCSGKNQKTAIILLVMDDSNEISRKDDQILPYRRWDNDANVMRAYSKALRLRNERNMRTQRAREDFDIHTRRMTAKKDLIHSLFRIGPAGGKAPVRRKHKRYIQFKGYSGLA